MSPQNWLCRSERNPALNTHGDNAYSRQMPDTKLTVTSKVQFLQLQHVFRQKCKKHNPSHVQRHTLQSQLLIIQFRLNTHNLSRVLQHQKQTQIFHAANKNLFIKIYFDSRHLTVSSSALQHSARKQHNVNTHTLQPFLATNNKNSSYKMVPPPNNNNHFHKG